MPRHLPLSSEHICKPASPMTNLKVFIHLPFPTSLTGRNLFSAPLFVFPFLLTISRVCEKLFNLTSSYLRETHLSTKTSQPCKLCFNLCDNGAKGAWLNGSVHSWANKQQLNFSIHHRSPHASTHSHLECLRAPSQRGPGI